MRDDKEMGEGGRVLCLDGNPRYVPVVSAAGRSLASGLFSRKPLFVCCVKPKLNIDLLF